MDDGKELKKETLAKAFKKNALALTSLEKKDVVIPAITYTLIVSGTG